MPNRSATNPCERRRADCGVLIVACLRRSSIRPSVNRAITGVSRGKLRVATCRSLWPASAKIRPASAKFGQLRALDSDDSFSELIEAHRHLTQAQIGRLARWAARLSVQAKLPSARTAAHQLLQMIIEAAGSRRQFGSLLLCYW